MNEFSQLFAQSGLSLERLHTFLDVAEAGNIANAAGKDPNRNSQFSRQLKDLEAYFGIALTRKVGRRIQITNEGQQLAKIIRQQFLDLDRFRKASEGQKQTLRIGASGSVIQWMLTPRLDDCRKALGGAALDLVQSRSADVVRGVGDGRLDIGIVRQDALSPDSVSLPLTSVGYSLFLPASLISKGSKARIATLLATLPVAMLLPGGRFQTVLDEWLAAQEVIPNVVARVSSFLAAASLVDASQAAAVLPDLAAAGFRKGKVLRKALSLDYQRDLALLWNPRGLDRAGFGNREVKKLARALK